MIKLVAFLLPALIDLINRKIISSDARFWISVLVCALVGTFLHYITSGFVSFDAWATDVLMVFGMAQLGYKAIYEGSNIQKTIRG